MDNTTTDPITIKKYANRRLYNKATSTYVTLDDLSQMVKQGVDFVVHDAKTGEDITHSVLTQIIVEEEAKGQSLLPTTFLRHLISFYGDNMQALVPRYLEVTMQAFARNQEQIRDQFAKSLDGLFPFANLEEMSRNNMKLLDSMMGMFNPLAGDMGRSPEKSRPPEGQGGTETLDEMRRELNRMQEQIDALAKQAHKNGDPKKTDETK